MLKYTCHVSATLLHDVINLLSYRSFWMILFVDTQPTTHVTRNRLKSESLSSRWPSSAIWVSYCWLWAIWSSHPTSSTYSTSTTWETFSSTSGSTKNFESLFCLRSNCRRVTRGGNWGKCSPTRDVPVFKNYFSFKILPLDGTLGSREI